jgi:phosphoribosylaminoimidazolecarboxamide formyltransferase/IMP cyclohydrolase
VDDKSGLVELGRTLASLGADLIATGTTRTFLTEGGVPTRPAEELTGIGAWFGGRIKTLHPGLLGGILAPRTPQGLSELEQRGLVPIDLVVVNFYPFVRHERDQPNAPDRAEFIDIGGVTLARAAAKNHAYVAVASDPSEYPLLTSELATHQGWVGAELRRNLARSAFARCAEYDTAIARSLAAAESTSHEAAEELVFRRDPLRLRYGENPHQRAWAYQPVGPTPERMPASELRMLQGTGLSYTNVLDLDAALNIVSEFPTPTAAVVKHATPCGVASGTTLFEAIDQAVATDPIARYGCVIGVNRALTPEDPRAMKGVFVDLLAAPKIDPAALEQLSRRSKLKVVEVPPPDPKVPRWEVHSAAGRLLIQEADQRQLAPEDFKLVTQTSASPKEACALDFSWRVVRHAKSNAVVLAQGSSTVGIGSGQTSRVKAVELAVEVAGPRAKGAVLASDGFFPFPDGVEVAGKAGVTAIIQPGGSIRDAEVLAAAERYHIAMYVTGWRVFRH